MGLTGEQCDAKCNLQSIPYCRFPLASLAADLSQVEITRAYMAKQADEISLQQADVVLLLGEEDGEWGLHLWAWPR